MDYGALPWLIAGGTVVFLIAAYAVIRVIVRIVRFIFR